jgi:hypothetical protein
MQSRDVSPLPPPTAAQYAALLAAYSSGVLRVTHENRTTEYRSLDEMWRALTQMRAVLDPAYPSDTTPPTRRLRVITSKGLW